MIFRVFLCENVVEVVVILEVLTLRLLVKVIPLEPLLVFYVESMGMMTSGLLVCLSKHSSICHELP